MHTLMHVWLCTCIHMYTYIHFSISGFQFFQNFSIFGLSVFLEFPYFCFSGNSRNTEILEIQKNRNTKTTLYYIQYLIHKSIPIKLTNASVSIPYTI